MMTFIEKVLVDGVVELHALEEAASLWRRKIEARRSLDWVTMTDDLVIQLNGEQMTTTVATVLDIEYNDSVTIVVLSSYLKPSVLEVFGIEVKTSSDDRSDLEVYLPVTISHNSRTISPITSAHVTNSDDSGLVLIQVLAKVLNEYMPVLK